MSTRKPQKQQARARRLELEAALRERDRRKRRRTTLGAAVTALLVLAGGAAALGGGAHRTGQPPAVAPGELAPLVSLGRLNPAGASGAVGPEGAPIAGGSELVLWHTIAEWGVEPMRDDWQTLLEDSIDEFERRRRAP